MDTDTDARGPYRFEIGEDLVVEAMRRNMARRLTQGVVGKLLLAIVVLLALLVVLELFAFGRLSELAIGVLIAAPLALLIVNLWLVPNLGRRQFRQSAALRAPATIAWDADSVSFASERGNATLPLAELHRWDETENVVLLYQTEMYFNLIPKAALGDATEDLVAALQAAGVKRN